MSPSMAKQVRIPGESSGGSGEAPMRFKVVSEEWCAAVDVARPHALELWPGSMSQSDLGEELSRSSRIQRGVSDVWGAWCGSGTSARGPAW